VSQPNNFEHNEGRPVVMKDVEAILSKIKPPSTGNPRVLGLQLHRQMEASRNGYPCHLYHEHLEPVHCLREDQEDELAKIGYGRTYIPRAYPRTLFRRNTAPRFDAKFEEGSNTQLTHHSVEERIVRDPDHEKAVRAQAKPSTAGPWHLKLDSLEPLADPETQLDKDMTIKRLEGQLEEARRVQAATKGK
jgi:hypothetical protein